jgi:hypothetical protein
MTTRLGQWFVGFQNSYAVLQKDNRRVPPENYPVSCELVLIMMGAGIAVSALPHGRLVEPTTITNRSPRTLLGPTFRSAISGLHRPVSAVSSVLPDILPTGSDP